MGFLRNSAPAPPNRGLFLSGGGVGGRALRRRVLVCEGAPDADTSLEQARQGLFGVQCACWKLLLDPGTYSMVPKGICLGFLLRGGG